MTKPAILPLLLAGALGACTSTEGRSATAQDLGAAIASLSADDLRRHIRVLASDDFEGRGPGTEGDRKTVEYLVGEFQALGLQPGNPDGTYVQKVPLMGFETSSTASFETAGGTLALERLRDYVAVSRLERADLADLEVVFVGYGTVAPEYGWDDYKGVDVTGKALVMLVNDPPVPAADDPERLDDALFRGQAMTYYGRWTYKYEIAKERGAAAAILVHETGPAGYPWEVVSGSWGREGFDLAGPEAAAAHVPVEAWVRREVAVELCRRSGLDFEQLKSAALTRDFRPVVLSGAAARFDCSAKIRHIESRNVVALRPGTHPEKKDELLVLTAHWDHLGRDPSLADDPIFNGALDNASGTAALLELAEASSLLEPDRSILFLAVTAEEKGLLGSKYYAAHPLHPLERTLANVNMDVLNPYGRTLDVVSIGMGFSTLDEVLASQAERQGRRVEPDAEPEKGFYFRSDHFSFVKQGVPALYAESGVDYRDRPEGWGREQRERYTAEDYHKPSDEVREDWDLSGALEDLELYLRIVWELSQGEAWPEWKDGSEFKAVREAMLAAGASALPVVEPSAGGATEPVIEPEAELAEGPRPSDGPTPIPPEITTPDRVETRLGTLRSFDGYPDQDTVRTLYDHLDFLRGVEVFLGTLPAAASIALRDGLRSLGVDNGTVALFAGPLDPSALLLAPEAGTIHLAGWLDLALGPLVLETPPDARGFLDDSWARRVIDLGGAGRDEGLGGKFLVLPPGYAREVPDGYVTVRSPTSGVRLALSLSSVESDPLHALESLRGLFRLYPLRTADDPPETKFVAATGVSFDTVHAGDARFFEALDRIVQDEPNGTQEPELLGQLASLGIVKGRPFAPTARLRAILDQAAVVGDATVRTILSAPRQEGPCPDRGSRWRAELLAASRAALAHGARSSPSSDTTGAGSAPEAVETRIGTLRFPGGFPDASTVERVYDNLDFARGVEVFLTAIPGASVAALRKGLHEVGCSAGTIGIFETLMDARSLFLTPNTETVYAMTWLDLKDGPVVVESPPNTLGIVDDSWFRYVADLGNAGPDEGQGGKFLFLPPDYRGEVPPGYFVYRSPTYGNVLFWRGFPVDGDPAPAVENIRRHARIHPLSSRGGPPEPRFVSLSGVAMNTIHASDFHFYGEVDEIVQEEPAGAQGPELAGLLAAIGIEKGEPFAPDPRMQHILSEAAAVGNATARALTFATRDREAYLYPFSQWKTAFVGGSHEFLRDGVRLLDARTLFHYYATGITPAMAAERVGVGSQYAYAERDARSAYLDGGKNYRLRLPADPPAREFWSLVVYDPQTRSELRTAQPFPSLGSLREGLASNPDGSVDVFFGPKAPRGKQGNWIQTVPGKGWNVILRLYGPLEPWFHETWRPGEIEPWQ